MFHKNEGFALLYAIFLIIIFSFIGLLIVSLLSSTSKVSSESLISSQALYYAESGKEIAIMRCLQGDCSNSVYDLYGNSVLIRYIDNVTLPNDRVLYTATSECIMKAEDIKREIEFKFWD